jgi:hypothetical protein
MNLIAKINLRKWHWPRQSLRRGVAAVEFALTLPIWIVLLLGLGDGTYCLLVNERADRIAYSVTDIVSQYQAVTLANLSNIVMAAAQLMEPYPFTPNGVVIITSVWQPPGGKPTVCWQYSGGGSLGGMTSQVGPPNNTSKNCTQGPVANLPNGLTLNDNDNVIISEVFYKFVPLFLNAGPFASNLIYRTAVYKPRLSLLTQAPS